MKHFYGFTYALGGMFAIKGSDFEKTQGFPNFWGWGLEDNLIKDRCVKAGLTIDRSNFYVINDPKIAHHFDGFNRLISKRDANVYNHENPDNLYSIKNLKYTIQNEFINISNFTCDMDPNEQEFYTYDIRRGSKIKVPQGFNRRVWSIKSIIKAR